MAVSSIAPGCGRWRTSRRGCRHRAEASKCGVASSESAWGTCSASRLVPDGRVCRSRYRYGLVCSARIHFVAVPRVFVRIRERERRRIPGASTTRRADIRGCFVANAIGAVAPDPRRSSASPRLEPRSALGAGGFAMGLAAHLQSERTQAWEHRSRSGCATRSHPGLCRSAPRGTLDAASGRYDQVIRYADPGPMLWFRSPSRGRQ